MSHRVPIFADRTVTVGVSRSLQRGVVLMAALIALVAMTLAALALVRSVDTGLVISGNLAFKQATTQAGDAGTETAVEWILANSAGLKDTAAASGYYANWMEACDLTGNKTPTNADDDVDWIGTVANPNCNAKARPVPSSQVASGYTASYIIHRMCDQDGSPNDPAVYCAAFKDPSSSTSDSTKGGAFYGSLPLASAPKQYYRITTRVVGPRNTTSFIQSVVAL